MKKRNPKTQRPPAAEEKECLLGGNVFSPDYLFDGDYAAKNPEIREKWPFITVRDWQRQIEPPGNFIKAMEAV